MNTVVGGFSVIKALKFLREEICPQIIWGMHIFSWSFWDRLKEGEASWAGSFPCKVFGKTSVQVVSCNRSLGCIAWAGPSISACTGSLVQTCWMCRFVHSWDCACAVGACSVSGRGQSQQEGVWKHAAAARYVFQLAACPSPEGWEAGPRRRWRLTSPAHALSRSWGIPVSEQNISDAASRFRRWVCWSARSVPRSYSLVSKTYSGHS